MPRLHNPDDVIGGRYRIIDFVGEGGMQEVYKATDTAFNRTVAVKVPKNPSAKKRFSRSAEMSAKVNHPNVAKTIDYIGTGSTFYLIEEFIAGTDLQKRFDEEFAYFDPHLAAHLMHHVAKGVAACHHVEVFHRDLKPSNIMVSADPSFSSVKLTDFGIAKMAEAEIEEAMEGGNESITGSHTVVGALPYMAPELITDPKRATKAADVWSLGAILFYLLFGERPYGASGLSVVAKILNEDLPPKASVVKIQNPQFSDLVNELWDIIGSCMQKDITKRITADELAKKLSGICYSLAPRNVGRIYNYGVSSPSWGFITANGENYFFHKDSFYGITPTNGMKVSFACFPGSPQDRAFPVLPLK